MSVQIKIEGIDKIIRKLGKVEGVKVLRVPMQRAVYRLHARMAQYPAVPPRSRYKRTGTLGRRWTNKITESGTGIIGEVGNRTPYAPFVQSYRFQRPIHRGRWQTDKYVLDTERRNIERDFKQAIDEALR